MNDKDEIRLLRQQVDDLTREYPALHPALHNANQAITGLREQLAEAEKARDAYKDRLFEHEVVGAMHTPADQLIKDGLERAYWITASPHEWNWSQVDQEAMARGAVALHTEHQKIRKQLAEATRERDAARAAAGELHRTLRDVLSVAHLDDFPTCEADAYWALHKFEWVVKGEGDEQTQEKATPE